MTWAVKIDYEAELKAAKKKIDALEEVNGGLVQQNKELHAENKMLLSQRLGQQRAPVQFDPTAPHWMPGKIRYPEPPSTYYSKEGLEALKTILTFPIKKDPD